MLKKYMFRKQQKNQSKLSKRDDEDTGPQELLERPKEYIVRLDTNRAADFVDFPRIRRFGEKYEIKKGKA